MTETPFYFPNGGRSLFGILHQPAEPGGRPPFVFCHPLAEEKLWAHRVFVSFARHLAARGHAVLRFDYMGNGDSEGDFRESSLSTALSDVRCAIDHVRRAAGGGPVSLLGLRLGATIASLAAEDADDVRHLVLWAPIVDGARYMQELLRINLTTQMAAYKEIRQDRDALVAAMEQGSLVNVDGYDLTHRMYSEVSAVRLAASAKRHTGPCLVAQIDRQTARTPPELQQLAASAKRHTGPCLVAQIDRQTARTPPELQQLAATYPGATLTAVQEEPFWKEILRFYDQAPNLFPATLEWLRTVDARVRH